MPTGHECNCKKPSIIDEMMKMSLDELVAFQQEVDKRVKDKQNEAKQRAYDNFVNAYLNFRAICPNDTALITAEADDAEIEIDLYEYLDFYFNIS